MRRDLSLRNPTLNRQLLTGDSLVLLLITICVECIVVLEYLLVCCRSFIPICSPKTSSLSPWSKPQQHLQMNHGERASTLPRTKPKTHSSPTLSAKPSISIFAPKPNSSPTPSPLTPKPSDSPPTSKLTDLSPLLHQPKPSVSPTLIVPTPRMSPSPNSLCQGMSSDKQGGKQPSPVAKERRARSITISNTKCLSDDARHNILDQETLLDFTQPVLRRSCPMTSKESQNPTYFENPCLLQSKRKKENNDKQKLALRNFNFTAIPIPKSNIKQQLDFLPSAVTDKQKPLSESERIKSVNVAHSESQSVCDGFTKQLSLKHQRKCTDYPQNRHYTQTVGFSSSHQSFECIDSERSGALPLTLHASFSTQPPLSQPTVSPNIESRRRRFDLHNEKNIDTAVLPHSSLRRPQEENNIQTVTGYSETSASQNTQFHQKHSLWLKAQSPTPQMDMKSTVKQFKCVSEDYSCKSRHINQKVKASQCAQRLNRLNTGLVASQTQEASRPASLERTTSEPESSPKPNTKSQKQPPDYEISPRENKNNHKELTLSDTGLNQRGIFTPPDHHVSSTNLLEYPSEKNSPSAAHCPFSTNSSGITTKGVLPSQPQHRVYQRPKETVTMVSIHPHVSSPNRAFIKEEPEDPYYVTMYYPGSVYVGEYRDIQTT